MGRPDSLGAPSAARLACLGVGVSMGAASVWLLNVAAYPGFNSFFPEARDIATTFSGLLALLFLLLAMHRPALFLRGGAVIAAVASGLLGTAGMFWSALLSDPLLATLSACLYIARGCLANVFIVCALVGMAPRARLVLLVCASAGKYAWMAALWLAPAWVLDSVLAVFSALHVVLALPAGLPAMRRLAGLEAPESLSATNPYSFLPLTSRVFAAILLFSAAFGFAITFQSHESVPQPTILAFAAFMLVMLLALRQRRSSLDSLYALAFGFALAGMLLVPSSSEGLLAGGLAGALLQAGSEVTNIVVTLTAAALGERNEAGLLPAVFAIRAVGSFGTELGTLSGNLQNALAASPELGGLFTAAITFGFAFCNFQLMRSFSFDRAVEGVLPAVAVPQIEETDERVPAIERSCRRISEERGLTPREAQVLELLARGRNASYIQESLTLSRNTVKSYVAHVYGKLGVHSHQELIDLVEGQGAA